MTSEPAMAGVEPHPEPAVDRANEMAGRIAAFDWSTTSLGPRSEWSASFQSLVQLILGSRFPMFVWVGPDLLHLYNDAYRNLLGDKHPDALGSRAAVIWAEIWDTVEPLTESVMKLGIPTFAEDLMLVVRRSGFEEETYFTFSYSPYVDADRIAGVFAAVFETTDRVVSDRRHGVQRAMSDALLGALTVDEVVAATIAALEQHGDDVTEALLYEFSGGAAFLRAATASGEGAAATLDADAVRMALSTPVSTATVQRLVHSGDAVPPDREGLLVWPLSAVASEPFGMLIVRPSNRRPFDEGFRSFLDVLAAQVVSAIGVARAYEAERRRVEALAELDAAKTGFFQNVSHELRTPLTLIIEPIRAVLAGELTDDQRDKLEMADRNGSRLQGLVDALLDTARIESGLMDTHFEPVDVSALTAQVVALFEGAFAAANIDVRTTFDDLGEPVWLDAMMWETIVSNLVANALKYCHVGSVTVSVGRQDDSIVLQVTDTGIGIVAEELTKVFDRFHRVRGSVGRSAEGTGIGLAMVKAMVELHAGTVAVVSAPGVGSTFSVQVPLGRRHGSVTVDTTVRTERRPGHSSAVDRLVADSLGWVSPGDSDVASPTVGTGRVVVIDDNPDMRAHLRAVLERRFEVRVAADAASGWTLIRDWRPEVVISDVMMAGVDGLELARRLRADPEVAHSELILLSARAGSEAADDGLRAGADDYLVKPFRADDLVRRVDIRFERALERRRGRDQQFRRDVLASLSTELGVADDIDAVAGAVMRALAAVGVMSAAVAVPDATDGLLRLYTADSLRGALSDQYHLLDVSAPVPAAEAFGGERVLVFADTAELAARGYTQVAEDLRLHGYGATAAIPLRDPTGAPMGSLVLGWTHRIEFDDDDIATFDSVGDRVSHALVKVRVSETERRLAESLQRELLRTESTSLRAAVARRYLPADHALLVGGDWFDVIDLPDQRLAIAVGDVVGSGVPAAATMSHLRTALSTALVSGQNLPDVRATLDKVAARAHGAACTTVACGILESDRHLTYFLAGHPPPVRVRPNGQAVFLDGGRSWPLAALDLERTAGVDRIRLDPGDLLVWYTDGLVERRDTPLDDRLEQLRAAVAYVAHLPTPMIVDRLIAEMTGDGRTDDVVVLALRCVGTTPTSHVHVIPAERTAISAARRALTAWLDALDVPATASSDFLLAMNEGIANAIEHGGAIKPSSIITIEAAQDADRLIGCIRDQGRWSRGTRTSATEGGGRGIEIMRTLCRSVDFARDEDGTTVTLVLEPKEATLNP